MADPASGEPAEPGGRPGFRPWREAWTQALYGDKGFYRRVEGPGGHFETSANAGGGVVEVLAAALAALARRHGCTTVVDIGAGRGELLRALAVVGPPRGVSAPDPGIPGPGADTWLGLVGVDVVPRPESLPASIRWLQSPGGAELPAELDRLENTLVIAHEWLDVVPCEVLEVDPDGVPRLVEVAIGRDGDGTERLGAPAGPDLLAWCARWWPVDDAAPGTRVEVGRARDAAWAGLVARVRSGVCLAVDYGHLAGERPPTGTLAGHRAGRLVHPVPDGSCDITAHVALDSLTPGVPTTQRAALRDLGVDGRLPPLSRTGGDSAARAVYLRDLRHAAAAGTLLDPGGLGGFGWLVHEVATGQPEPAPARVGR
jgi:SAM-dependent MidA family methyltransferase